MILRIVGFALLLLSVNTLTAQTTSQYKEVDALVKSFPVNPRSVSDIRVLQHELKRQLKTEDELARAAFIWISSNIAYDCEGLNKNTGLYELDDVIAHRKGICAGYAALFKDFCDQFNLECQVVNGFALTSSDKLPDSADYFKVDHAWNVVKVNGAWKLIDVTWGSGYTSDNCKTFTRLLDEKYFYSRPEEFIKNHLPADTAWQLLQKPFSNKQFIDSARYYRKKEETVYEETSIPTLPKDSVIIKEAGETIRFTFPRKDLRNAIGISDADSYKTIVFDSLQVSDTGYYYDYKVTKPGKSRIYVSLLYDKHTNEEMEGTESETYLVIVRPKKVKSTNPVNKKPVKFK